MTDTSSLDEILTKIFIDYYDYMTEQDILKAAHEYSEKTVYKEAKAAIQSLIAECLPEKQKPTPERYATPQLSMNAGYNQAIDTMVANLKGAGLL